MVKNTSIRPSNLTQNDTKISTKKRLVIQASSVVNFLLFTVQKIPLLYYSRNGINPRYLIVTVN
ncbi:hypothetical protein HNP81_001226 [Peribacillus huizhouensis]|uniref:Uncharacterized protein n=1 Tax=Peribacillus huizhouensis TaxID=1501239 RepID=A0ABR6CMI2_9BACI|nr:hypothetical protein [Peribacillus huizhouensis]